MTKTLSLLVLGCLIPGLVLAAAPASAVPDQVYNYYAQRDYVGARKLLIQAQAAAVEPSAKFALSVELGDLYLDKLRDYPAAESVYSSLIEQFPNEKSIADVVYRLAVADERQEKYLEGAQNYEKVAIKYQGSKYSEDALNAIERCFQKNYQDTAAVVDGYRITRLEFDNMVSRSPAQYEKYDDKLKLLNQMIDDRLLYVAAEQKKLYDNPDFVKQMNDFRRDQMLQTWYDREVVKKVVIDDSMKRNYYRDHRNDYVTPEQLRAREIQVKTREQADSIYDMLTRENQPFDSLARKYSQAPDKERGGDMGFFRKNTRAREIDSVAFAMKVGDISRPFKTGDGYVILKLEEKRDRKERTFDEVAAEIEGRLKPQKTQARLNQLLSDMRKGRVVQDSLAIASDKETLAVVDGTPILKAELAATLERIPPMYRPQYDNPQGKKQIMDQLLTEKLVLRVAEMEKLWLLSDVVGATIDREHSVLMSLIKKTESTDKVKVDEKQMQADYKKTIKDFKVAEQVRAKEIELKTRTAADSVRRLLIDTKHPVSFDSLAKTVSIASSRWAAGDMGLLTRGSKPKPIDNALFSQKPKAIGPVVKVNDTSYVIIKVDERKKAYTRPFTEVKPKIERKLRQEAEKQLLDDYLAGLRKKANIEIVLKDEPPEPMPAETIPPEEPGKGQSSVTPVPARGEPVPSEITPQTLLGSVYFRSGGSALSADARKTLDSLAASFKKDPGLNLVLVGNSDKNGSAEINEKTGMARARKVMQYLEKSGIVAGRMEVKSLGETQAKGTGPDDYWKDRRVDIYAK